MNIIYNFYERLNEKPLHKVTSSS